MRKKSNLFFINVSINPKMNIFRKKSFITILIRKLSCVPSCKPLSSKTKNFNIFVNHNDDNYNRITTSR